MVAAGGTGEAGPSSYNTNNAGDGDKESDELAEGFVQTAPLAGRVRPILLLVAREHNHRQHRTQPHDPRKASRNPQPRCPYRHRQRSSQADGGNRMMVSRCGLIRLSLELWHV